MGEKNQINACELFITDPATEKKQRIDGIKDCTIFEAVLNEQEVEELKAMQASGELTLHCEMPKKSYRKLKRFLIKAEIKQMFKNIKQLLK